MRHNVVCREVILVKRVSQYNLSWSYHSWSSCMSLLHGPETMSGSRISQTEESPWRYAICDFCFGKAFELLTGCMAFKEPNQNLHSIRRNTNSTSILSPGGVGCSGAFTIPRFPLPASSPLLPTCGDVTWERCFSRVWLSARGIYASREFTGP